MKRGLILLPFLILLFFARPVSAQKHDFLRITTAADYPFLLYLPSDSIMKTRPPLILFLHGRSLSGNDLNMVLRYGPLDAIERGRTINAVVAAPQIKKGQNWDPDKSLTVINYIEKKYAIDTTRIYVIGMSLGGYGTFGFVGKYPEKVAAAVALCGGGNVKEACNITRTNIWIQHGKRDRAVNYSESEKMYNAIMACDPKANCFLTLYPTLGHGELAHEFTKDTLYNWLFKFRLEQKPKDSNDSITSIRKQMMQDSLMAKKNQQLKPDAKQSAEKPHDKETVHIIKKGDTLYAIALKYKTTVKYLCQINGIREDAILHIGQRIIIKQ